MLLMQRMSAHFEYPWAWPYTDPEMKGYMVNAGMPTEMAWNEFEAFRSFGL